MAVVWMDLDDDVTNWFYIIDPEVSASAELCYRYYIANTVRHFLVFNEDKEPMTVEEWQRLIDERLRDRLCTNYDRLSEVERRNMGQGRYMGQWSDDHGYWDILTHFLANYAPADGFVIWE